MMANTKITCPSCGRWGYYVLEEKNKLCRSCGEPLDLLDETVSIPEPQEGPGTMNTAAARGSGNKSPFRRPGQRAQAPEVSTEDRPYIEMNELRTSKQPVRVFCLNGFQIHGVIDAFDRDCVIVFSDGVRKIVPMSAISTIEPKV